MIGFFDSGAGGKFVADYFMKRNPQYRVITRNDPANMPYGDKPETVLRVLLEKHIRSLFEEGCMLVVVACNTLSVRLVRELQDGLVRTHYPDRKLLGVVIPTVEAMSDSEHASFLLLATVGTVASRRYQQELQVRNSSLNVTSVPVANLAMMIEQNQVHKAQELARKVIDEASSHDAIVLACTHYAALKDFLRETYPKVAVFSQDEIVTERLEKYLDRHPEIESRIART